MLRCLTFLAILILTPAVGAQERTQIHFTGPSGMKVFWQAKIDGKVQWSKQPLETPGRFNFQRGAAYRLKLTHIAGHPGLELFPTLEVSPANRDASEFLAHNSVPISLSEDEVNQVVKGSFLVKVVYLPTHPGDGEIATTTGQDAVGEAARRGHVLLVLRIGNIRAAD